MRARPPEIPAHFFAEAIRDEVWRVAGHGSRLISRRLDQGYAWTSSSRGHGKLEASSDLSAVQPPPLAPEDLPRNLAARVSVEHRNLIRSIERCSSGEMQVRVRHSARFITRGAESFETASIVLILETPTSSIMTSPDNLTDDLEMLSALDRPFDSIPGDYRSFPMLWLSGSAGVLLHEAVGHRSLHHEAPEFWPDWLRVIDDPTAIGPGHLPVDDTGTVPERRELLAGQRPSALRREDYRHAPLPRMSNLVVGQSGAPFEMPRVRIDVHFAHEGGYDPLLDEIRLEVTGTIVEDERRSSLVRFEIRESCLIVARALAGARGVPVRFPGILCAEEGQRVVTGCLAPEIVTRPFEQCENDT